MTTSGLDVATPARRDTLDAVRFLVGGAVGASLMDSQARALADRLAQEKGLLVWACREGEPQAAAAILPTPGNVGFLLFSPPAAPGVDPEALPAAIDTVSLLGLDRGVRFIQALIEPGASAELDILPRAGMSFIAALCYMRLDVPPGPAAPPADPPGRTWVNALDFTPERLSTVIQSTYERSLDCPGILGARRPEEVLAGHRANGRYRPECWWILVEDGQDAGCILVNDSNTPGVGEVAYMGVAAGFRGRRLAGSLLERAVFQARQRGLRRLQLAADEQNPPAMSVYRRAGFHVTHRRLVWVRLPSRPTPC